MGRSRSRSRSYSDRSRSRSNSRSRSRSASPGHRVHVADLARDASQREIEKAFERFGKVSEVWLAKNPPCFAFIVFKYKDEAEDAVREMNGVVLCGNRVRVSMALPRTRGRRGRRGFDPNMRCYTCGESGHFSRDCDGKRFTRYGFSRRRSRSWSPRDRRRRSRSRSRDHRRRSRSRSFSRSRSRSNTPARRRQRKDSGRRRSSPVRRSRNFDEDAILAANMGSSKRRRSGSMSP